MQPEATIFHVGVLPPHRGQAYVDDLLGEMTRLFVSIGAWQATCDTGATNKPMIEAFRRAGYREMPPCERPVD